MSFPQMDPSTLRRRLAAISKQSALAAQGYRTSPPLAFAREGGYLVGGRRPRRAASMEMVAPHHVHGYERPQEFVHPHLSHSKKGKPEHVRGHTRHAGPVHGYEMPAHLIPTHHASPSHRGGARSHHAMAQPTVADLVYRLQHGGMVIGGRAHSGRQPSAYNMFVKRNYAKARAQAMGMGLIGGGLSQETMRILGHEWSAMHGHGY